jgi:hypothetical protein
VETAHQRLEMGFPPILLFYWVLKKEKRKKEIEKKEKRGKLVSIPYSM